MTSGAAGAINTVLKPILDPGDEVIVLSPYFPEYRFYIENHAGRVVPVETDERFQPDPARIAARHHPAHQGAHPQFAQQSDRRGLRRGRAARTQPRAPRARCW